MEPTTGDRSTGDATARDDADRVHTTQVTGVRSRAAIGGHPLHPMVIPLPIGLLVAVLVTDVAFWLTDDGFWARVSWWGLWGGLVTGIVAAALGLTEFLGIPRVRELSAGRLHLVANALALLLTTANLVVRGMAGTEEAVLPWGLALTVVTNAAIGVGGWVGGELSYRHAIGVTGPGARRPASDGPDAGRPKGSSGSDGSSR